MLILVLIYFDEVVLKDLSSVKKGVLTEVPLFRIAANAIGPQDACLERIVFIERYLIGPLAD